MQFLCKRKHSLALKINVFASETEQMHTVSSKTELQLCQSEEKQNEETDAKATLTDDQLSNVPMITLIPCPEDTLIMFSAQSGKNVV